MSERSGYYFDVNAYRNSRRVRRMTWEARAIYREIMDEIWLHGSVPTKIEEIAELVKIPLEIVTSNWSAVHECLIEKKHNPDELTSERMEEERRRRNKIKRLKKNAGKLGGQAKAKNHASKNLASASAILPTQDKNKTRQEQVIPIASSDSGESPPQHVIQLPLNTGDEFGVEEKLADEWKKLYPNVDVAQELREMRAWLITNPTRRKTKRGILRFCNSWLAGAQDRAPKLPLAKAASVHDFL